MARSGDGRVVWSGAANEAMPAEAARSANEATQGPMKATVRLYGRLRDVAGVTECEVELDGGGRTVADLADRLRAEHPELADHLDSAAYAVDDRLVEPDQVLPDGDAEIGVLPPVSGG